MVILLRHFLTCLAGALPPGLVVDLDHCQRRAVLAEYLAADDTMVPPEEEIELAFALIAAFCLFVGDEVGLSQVCSAPTRRLVIAAFSESRLLVDRL